MHLLTKKENRRCPMKRTSLCAFVLVFALPAVYSATPVNDRQEAGKSDPELTWVGKLVDQACKEKNIDHNCPVSPTTEHFGLVIDGGIILPFDEASNQMTHEVVAKDGRKGNIEVSVVGERQAGLFRVRSIETAK
jgi:hypothetical protein